MSKKTPFYLAQAITNEGFKKAKIEAPTKAKARTIFFNLYCCGIEIKDLKIKRIGDNVKQERLFS